MNATPPFHVLTQLPDGYWHVLAVGPLGYAEAKVVTSTELIEIIQRLSNWLTVLHRH